ncbi:hypothetical protein TCE0_015f02730 [Talaromyces pinophilus]|uniref:Uncharacterized protein n=1 Tax=Talaromyces pinophilus TaxID=128442 RepID=A0A6V8H209_TALPI|nr:hypothetical protein TCE0_015f02730 [Talaromyces pinophilus]
MNRMASSRFIEILDNTTAQQHQISSSDVKLEDVLADQEATPVVTVVADFAGAEDEEVEKVYIERWIWAVICLSVSPLMGWVGNEFSSVEALWSQFENVMGAEEGQQQQAQQQQQQQGQDNRGDGEEEEEGDDDVDVKQEDEYEAR